jgi:hypothetical protein
MKMSKKFARRFLRVNWFVCLTGPALTEMHAPRKRGAVRAKTSPEMDLKKIVLGNLGLCGDI